MKCCHYRGFVFLVLGLALVHFSMMSLLTSQGEVEVQTIDELETMQQPWRGLSPAQVVGAVAFQNRRLAIPPTTSQALASLMESCWADDPAQRPSFASIVESLKRWLKSPAQYIRMGGGGS